MLKLWQKEGGHRQRSRDTSNLRAHPFYSAESEQQSDTTEASSTNVTNTNTPLTSDDEDEGEASTKSKTPPREKSDEGSAHATDVKAPKRQDRRFELPQENTAVPVKTAWVLSDSVGVKMLKDLTQQDMVAKAPYIYKHYQIVVQEAVRDDFLALHGELQLMLAFEEVVPQAVIYHCGAFLIGDRNCNRFQIETQIVREMGVVKGKLAAAEMVEAAAHDVATVWSRMVAHPMSSRHFNLHTMFNTLKTMNTNVAAVLFKKKIGIMKHCDITPAGKHFTPEGEPTIAAKMIFLKDVNNYLKELDEEERLQEAYECAGLPRKDKAMQLKLLQAQQEKAELTRRFENLQRKFEEAQKTERWRGNTPLQFREDGRARTWEGRNERKRAAWSPKREERSRERPQTERAHRDPNRSDRADPEDEEGRIFAMFQRYEKFRRTQQGGGDNRSRRQLHFD